jgi:hypothetical protein
MPDILGDLIRRIDALEAAVLGQASEFFNRKLFKPQVALREGRHPRSIERDYKGKDKKKKKFPPPDGVTNGREWWWLSTLERHDREQAGLPVTTRTPPNAGKGRPRQRKHVTAQPSPGN